MDTNSEKLNPLPDEIVEENIADKENNISEAEIQNKRNIVEKLANFFKNDLEKTGVDTTNKGN